MAESAPIGDIGLSYYKGGFPLMSVFNLYIIIRRSVASVPANIAEGCGRKGERRFSRFLSIAAGSAGETKISYSSCP